MLCPAAPSTSLPSCFCETRGMPWRLSPCVVLGEWAEHTHTWNVSAGLQAKCGFTSVGNFCFGFQLSLLYGPLSPHQDPVPSSLLFFLFSFYILASNSTSWCDVYCSNGCRESRGWWQVLTLLSSHCCCPPAVVLAVCEPDNDGLPHFGFVVCFSYSNLGVLCPRS